MVRGHRAIQTGKICSRKKQSLVAGVGIWSVIGDDKRDFIAVRIGNVRLIDNMDFSINFHIADRPNRIVRGLRSDQIAE